MVNRLKLLRILLSGTLLVFPLCAGMVGPTGPICVEATLDKYLALPNGCVIGPDFTFKDFGFRVLNASGDESRHRVIGPSDIVVVPRFDPDEALLALLFTSSGFRVGSRESVQYLLSYTIDPPPPEIIRFELEMVTETPVFPGIARITTDLCVGEAFKDSTCPGKPDMVSVFHNGISARLVDTTNPFPPSTAVLGVRNTILLDGGPTGSADFRSFENRSFLTPEPASIVVAASGLLLLLARRAQAKTS